MTSIIDPPLIPNVIEDALQEIERFRAAHPADSLEQMGIASDLVLASDALRHIQSILEKTELGAVAEAAALALQRVADKLSASRPAGAFSNTHRKDVH